MTPVQSTTTTQLEPTEERPQVEQVAPRPIAKTRPDAETLTDFDLWNLAFDEAETCSR